MKLKRGERSSRAESSLHAQIEVAEEEGRKVGGHVTLGWVGN